MKEIKLNTNEQKKKCQKIVDKKPNLGSSGLLNCYLYRFYNKRTNI